jgi:hypothetical protein
LLIAALSSALVPESLPGGSLGAFPRSSDGARSRNLEIVTEIRFRVGPRAAEDFVGVSAIDSSDCADQIGTQFHLSLDKSEKRVKYRVGLILGVLGSGLNKHAAGRDNAYREVTAGELWMRPKQR